MHMSFGTYVSKAEITELNMEGMDCFDTGSNLTTLLFILLIVTIFVSAVVKISCVLSGLPFTLFPPKPRCFQCAVL